ncbi:nuclear export factor GLE1 [Mycolicibacterium sp. GF69]|uniref:YcnI family copper-binding membrane protein n=1 Tax=Mycolicibacterium sp. GF69 TaxID=2267251 RepID=UPI000DCE0FE9|nr:YcnI family protein [Mycolicibacterium sp. GF69]RAV11382.1 nuclear export factor GLE1 [Mycolicibacterium sp. GF69]
MRPITRAAIRALITVAAVATTLALAGTASAHVHVDADNATPGNYAVLTFRVPGESETGALTTELTVELPDLTSVRTEVMPGWTTRLDRDVAAGTVRSITWTAAPGTGISPEQFGLFRASVKLPDGDSASFPATQTYDDGTVVRWDQPALPDGGEPDHPVPVLSLATTQEAPGATDNVSRWLAGAALLVAAAGVVVALTGRRRA